MLWNRLTERGRKGLLLPCLQSRAGSASLLQVNTPGAPAKIPLRGQTEQKLCHPVAGRAAEMVVPGGDAQRQEGMAVSTAPGLQREVTVQCCLHCRNALLQPGISAGESFTSTVKYCSCAPPDTCAKLFRNGRL